MYIGVPIDTVHSASTSIFIKSNLLMCVKLDIVRRSIAVDHVPVVQPLQTAGSPVHQNHLLRRVHLRVSDIECHQVLHDDELWRVLRPEVPAARPAGELRRDLAESPADLHGWVHAVVRLKIAEKIPSIGKKPLQSPDLSKVAIRTRNDLKSGLAILSERSAAFNRGHIKSEEK
jgi:hypothetical protein